MAPHGHRDNKRERSMAKDRNKKGREAKKPKADKKVVAPASTFPRPQPAGAQPKAKDGK
jgi:hypothetical protein